MSQEETSDDTEVEAQEINADDVEKEEHLMFGYGGKDRQPVDLLSDYLPEKEDYAAKTVITQEQVHLLASLEQLTVFFDEINEYDDAVEQWIKSYEKRLTSVHGLSRDEFLKIIVSMNGGSVDESSSRGLLEKVLEADVGDNDG